MIFQRFSISPSWSRSFSCGSDPHEFLDGFLGFRLEGAFAIQLIWLVVSTHLKNISQIGNHPQVGVNIKNIWNHHLVIQLNMENCSKTFWTLPTKKPIRSLKHISSQKRWTISIMETSKFQRSGKTFSIAAILGVQGCLARWWLNQPILKNMQPVKLERISPGMPGWTFRKTFELPPPSWVAGSSPLEFLWLTVDDIEDHASESSRSQDASICKCSGQTACERFERSCIPQEK